MYLGPCQVPMAKIFGEKGLDVLAISYFPKKATL